MDVILADTAGMCFGVRDALKRIDAVADPRRVTVHGQLVHNEVVLQQLAVRGFAAADEDRRDRLPETPAVLVTAHGVSDRERSRLAAAGKEVIDTTCPLVRRAHAAAVKLRDAGYHVLVIGRPGHVEVRGIVEDLPSHAVVPDAAAVRRYPFAKLGVMCQTTTPPRLAADVLLEIERQNPHAEVRFSDTICHPTRDHQASLDRLLPAVDAVVVVGGRNSNNTRELVRRAEAAGVPAYHVQGAGELRAEWFAGRRRVGLTAGTSTLDATVREVRAALEGMAG
jgi:4-hydroxy-3-methylbut-2-enyl diphosphate reductase